MRLVLGEERWNSCMPALMVAAAAREETDEERSAILKINYIPNET